jgi:hypothetical protein
MITRNALLADLESDFTATEASVGVLETAFTPFASPTENMYPQLESAYPL